MAAKHDRCEGGGSINHGSFLTFQFTMPAVSVGFGIPSDGNLGSGNMKQNAFSSMGLHQNITAEVLWFW